MKMSKYGWIVVGVCFAAGVAVLARLVASVEVSNRAEMDGWVDGTLAEALGSRLRRPPKLILSALRGTPDPELARLVRESVEAVTLTFTRTGDAGRVTVGLEVRYKDGATFARRVERSWEGLPESVRSEFLRGGAAAVERRWEFPW
jgi:hypothetical protein